MNPSVAGAASRIRSNAMEAQAPLRMPSMSRHSPCNWSDGGFIDLQDDDDAEADLEYEDDDAIRDYSSTSGSDSETHEERKGYTRTLEDERGHADEIVINALTRHISVSMTTYTVYYDAMTQGAARPDWASSSLQDKQPKPVHGGKWCDRSQHGAAQHGPMCGDSTPIHSAPDFKDGEDDSGGSQEEDDDSDIFPKVHGSWLEHCEERHRYRPHLWRESSVLGLPILPPDHMLSLTWASIMLVMDMVYSAFMVPLAAAFCFHPEKGVSWCTFAEYIAGPIFIVNVILGFHIGFVLSCNLRKMYIMRSHLIARFYVTNGGFWLDMLGVLAFIIQMVMVVSAQQRAHIVVRLLLIMRIIRVYRILTVMLVASVSESSGKEVSTIMSSVGLYALTLLFTGAFFINFFACVFYIIADTEGLGNSWLARYQSNFGDPAVPAQNILDASWARHWQLGVYYVTTTLVTVGYGDVTPATTAEQLAAILMMLSAACLFAVLISSISEALSSLTSDARSGSAVRKKLVEVLQWMEDRKVAVKDQLRIMGYYGRVWRQHHKDYENELQIFEELPAVLRGKVAKSMIKQLLGRSIILPSRRDVNKMVQWNLHPAHVELLAERFVPVEVMPGHELFVEGDDADSVYLLEEGCLEVWQHQTLLYVFENPMHMGWDDKGNAITEHRSQWIGNSSILGFFNIPNARKRPMQVRAQVSSKLWRLELESLKPVMRTQLEFVKLLIRIFRFSMVRALRAEAGAGVPSRQSSKSNLLETREKIRRASTGVNTLRPINWTEFNALMYLDQDDPELNVKKANYRKWADLLEKAKTSQIISLLGRILRESPIANEMNDVIDAESAANDAIRASLVQANSGSVKPNKTPISRIRANPSADLIGESNSISGQLSSVSEMDLRSVGKLPTSDGAQNFNRRG